MRRTVEIAALVLLVVGVPAAGRAQTCDRPHAGGLFQERLESAQRAREYRLFLPATNAGDRPFPLVLDLHGSGGTSAGQAKTSGLETLAARERFAVASLQADGGRWNVPIAADRPDDLRYVTDVIDHVRARACVDPARVYVTGFSGGGRMSSLIGCRLGDRIAAIAPVAGLRWPAPCDGPPVPVLAFHGLADAQNPYDGQAAGRGAEWEESVPDALADWARHNGCASAAALDDPPGPLSTVRYGGCAAGAEVLLIRIDGLGHVWPRTEVDATAVMWEFFRNHGLAR